MNSTVISTSLPAIAADIGTSPIALKLALTAYLVSLAVFIPVSGWMADSLAQRMFSAPQSSYSCSDRSPVPSQIHCWPLSFSRFLQGMGGAMMTPVGRLVLRALNPAQRTGRRDGLADNARAHRPLLGPPVGGFLTTYFSWHWIFLINVPIGIIGIWFATRYLPYVETLVRRPLDVMGFFLSGIAASGVVSGFRSSASRPAFMGGPDNACRRHHFCNSLSAPCPQQA